MKRALITIAKAYKINLAILFGSAATHQTHQRSDIDIAVKTLRPLSLEAELRLRSDLSHAFKKEIDLVDLQRAGPLLLGQIARDGKLLYGSKIIFNNFRVEAMKRYIDFEPYFRMREDYLNHKLSISHA